MLQWLQREQSFAEHVHVLLHFRSFSSSSSLITTARLAALLRAEPIAIAIAAAVAEGSADALLVVVPAGQGLCLVLAVAVVALVAAHIAVDVVCEMEQASESGFINVQLIVKSMRFLQCIVCPISMQLKSVFAAHYARSFQRNISKFLKRSEYTCLQIYFYSRCDWQFFFWQCATHVNRPRNIAPRNSWWNNCFVMSTNICWQQQMRN